MSSNFETIPDDPNSFQFYWRN